MKNGRSTRVVLASVLGVFCLGPRLSADPAPPDELYLVSLFSPDAKDYIWISGTALRYHPDVFESHVPHYAAGSSENVFAKVGRLWEVGLFSGLKKGQTIWIQNPHLRKSFVISSLEVVAAPGPNPSLIGLRLRTRPNVASLLTHEPSPDRLTDYAVVSDHPLPEQTWTRIPLSYPDINALQYPGKPPEDLNGFEVQSGSGTLYAMLSGKEQPDGSCAVDLLRQDQGVWHVIARPSQCGLEPFLDIDGDGVPEVLYAYPGSVDGFLYTLTPEFHEVLRYSTGL